MTMLGDLAIITYSQKIMAKKRETSNTEKKCPKCGQRLRFPENIGGMLMACPSCGKKFHSDFKLGSTRRSVHREILTTVFEMPCKIMKHIGRYFTSKYRANPPAMLGRMAKAML
jgi:tRNA(Ile2) C34 agmatinyltransferase TiaS